MFDLDIVNSGGRKKKDIQINLPRKSRGNYLLNICWPEFSFDEILVECQKDNFGLLRSELRPIVIHT